VKFERLDFRGREHGGIATEYERLNGDGRFGLFRFTHDTFSTIHWSGRDTAMRRFATVQPI
jgi:hypothetical protein